MDRRQFLKGAATTTVGAGAAAAAAPAFAQGKRTLKMVTTWGKNFPGLGTAAENIAKRINAMSDGNLTVKVYAAGELVPAFESFDAVSQGTADMYHAAEYYWQGKHKAFNFFTAVPMGMTANEIDAWIQHGGGQELWDKLSAKFNLKCFMAANTGVQMGGWYNKEINSLEDFKGLKIRMPGLGGEVMRRLGAAAVALPGGEIFPALQSGSIDATEWVGPWNDLAYGFYKVTKFYYWPGFHEPGSALALGLNKDVWESLTPSQQAIIENAAIAENNSTYAEYNAKNGAALSTLIDKHGVQLRQFPDEIWKEVVEKSAEVIEEAGQVDDLSGEILASFKQGMKDIGGWTAIADAAYMAARARG